MFSKNKLAMLVAEFLGTAILASAVLGIVSGFNLTFFSAVIAGLTVGVLVLVLGNISGAHLNPGVSLGLWSAGEFPTAQALVYVAAQVLGGLAALVLASYLLDQKVTGFFQGDLFGREFVAELCGGFVFTLGVASAIYQKYAGLRLAATIGAAFTVAILVASLGRAGIVNPAVAITERSLNWSFMLGPVVGGILGVNAYKLFFVPPKTSKKRK